MSLHSTRVVEAIHAALVTVLAGKAKVALEENRPDDAEGGLVVVRWGEVEQTEALLSPRAFSYEHTVPVEIAAPTRAEVDALLLLIDHWIETNRGLGGLSDWLEAQAPKSDEAEQYGTEIYSYALVDLVASYTLPSPLS